MTGSLGALLHGLVTLETSGRLDIEVRGVAYDSRRVVEGGLFVAVKGTKLDGALFIEDAIRRGATVIVAEEFPVETGSATCVRVPDSRRALAVLAANFFNHPSRDLVVIGVTGTNGKTTTTLLLESILRAAGHSVGVLGTLAYRWPGTQLKAPMTTPESLDLQRLLHEMREDGVTHVVMEVSSHALALGRVDGCLFDAGIFTNLSQDHLDFHSTMEEYFAAKSLLFKERLNCGGKRSAAVINRDDPFGIRLIENGARDAWSYSVQGRDARLWVNGARLSASGIEAEFIVPDGRIEIRSSLIGRLNLYNISAAVAAASALGAPDGAIRAGVAELSTVDGRLQRVPVPSEAGCEVVVDYAHTPDAMEKSIECLREMTAGRLIVVFGCGGDRDRSKRPRMGAVAARLGDLVVLTSDNPRSEAPEKIIEEIEAGVKEAGFPPLKNEPPAPGEKGYAVETDRRKAIGIALSWAGPGDLVFIGGKGHETYQIIGGEVLSFDDRTVVRDYYGTGALTGSPERENR